MILNFKNFHNRNSKNFGLYEGRKTSFQFSFNTNNVSAFLSAGLVSKKMPLVGDSNLRIFADEVTSKGSTVYVNCRLDVLSSIDFKDLSNTVTDMLTDYLSQYTDNNHSLGFLRDATNKQTTITNLVVDGI